MRSRQSLSLRSDAAGKQYTSLDRINDLTGRENSLSENGRKLVNNFDQNQKEYLDRERDNMRHELLVRTNNQQDRSRSLNRNARSVKDDYSKDGKDTVDPGSKQKKSRSGSLNRNGKLVYEGNNHAYNLNLIKIGRLASSFGDLNRYEGQVDEPKYNNSWGRNQIIASKNEASDRNFDKLKKNSPDERNVFENNVMQSNHRNNSVDRNGNILNNYDQYINGRYRSPSIPRRKPLCKLCEKKVSIIPLL